MKNYVADFETTVPKARDYEIDDEGEAIIDLPEVDESTRVWAYGLCEVGNVEETFEYGTTMEDFFKWCAKKENKNVYFHNLKFDGKFIIDYLLRSGFQWVKDRKEYRDMTFTTIISGMGQFYQIEVVFKRYGKKYNKVTFLDSAKKLPFTVDRIGKAFKLPLNKIEVNKEFYARERAIDHVLTDEEIAYLKHDVLVVAMALGIQFDQGLTKMTVGSDALNGFKEVMGKTEFKVTFPVLPMEMDAEIRKAYKGGFTYVNPRYAGKDIESGIVFDVNSLYPAVMYNKVLPYGVPIEYEGEYEYDEEYPLYIQNLTCEFTLKKDKIPTIQLKNSGRFVPTEYVTESGVEPVTLNLTNVDLELFFEHYDVTCVHEWGKGYKFKGMQGAFKDYIDYWMKIKETSEGAIRELAKLMLNSLYGKFASNPDVTGKYPVMEDGVVKYKEGEEELKAPIYTAMGAFITAWARRITISAGQQEFHRFIYADTDSLHLEGTEEPDIDIHKSRIGAWKCEGTFTRGRFLRAKTYIEEMDGHLHVTCAGMPDPVKEQVTWDNFRKGLVLSGKLLPKTVAGGVILRDTEFTLN